MSNDIPQLLTGPNESASLITSHSSFDISSISFSGNPSITASGNIYSNGNLFVGVTENILGVSNVPNILSSGDIVVGGTGYFPGTADANNVIINSNLFFGTPNSQGSFKFQQDNLGALRVYLWNTSTNQYDLSMKLEHFC